MGQLANVSKFNMKNRKHLQEESDYANIEFNVKKVQRKGRSGERHN